MFHACIARLRSGCKVEKKWIQQKRFFEFHFLWDWDVFAARVSWPKKTFWAVRAEPISSARKLMSSCRKGPVAQNFSWFLYVLICKMHFDMQNPCFLEAFPALGWKGRRKPRQRAWQRPWHLRCPAFKHSLVFRAVTDLHNKHFWSSFFEWLKCKSQRYECFSDEALAAAKPRLGSSVTAFSLVQARKLCHSLKLRRIETKQRRPTGHKGFLQKPILAVEMFPIQPASKIYWKQAVPDCSWLESC